VRLELPDEVAGAQLARAFSAISAHSGVSSS
jgi:hypothetical protein